MKKVSIALTGDSFITQRLPRDAKFAALKDFLSKHDVRFTNFEILLHDFEVYLQNLIAGSEHGHNVASSTCASAHPDMSHPGKAFFV